jgi:mycothiol synthase
MDDVPALTALIGRVTTALLGYPDASPAEVRDDLTGARFDIARDTIVAVREDGDVVVYAQGFDEHDELGWLDVYIDPCWDGPTFEAIADATIAACLGQIRGSAALRGATSVQVKAGIYQQETAMRAAYERAGLGVETMYWRLGLDLDPDSDFSSPLPPGVELRRVDPQDDKVMRTALELVNETFRDHHGHVDMSYDYFVQYWRDSEKYDPEAWWFAVVNGVPAGLLLGDDTRVGDGVGFVRTLGVRKEMRGRGIAKSLLLNAFDDYRRRGRSAVQLGVDAQNATGATRLYEGLGMRPLLTTVAMGGALVV